MNIELRDVLNLDMDEEDEESNTFKGLNSNMFRKYSLVQELHHNDQPESKIDSLVHLINSEDWNPDCDRYYELEFFGNMSVKDEDRVYTQIRRC